MLSNWVCRTCRGLQCGLCGRLLLADSRTERMFAAPFLCQLGRGHVEGIQSMAKDPSSLQRFASGSADGVVKV